MSCLLYLFIPAWYLCTGLIAWPTVALLAVAGWCWRRAEQHRGDASRCR